MKFFAFLLVALSSACSLLAADPTEFEVGGLKFQRPSDWAWVEVSSPMRKAQLKVPAAGGEAGADITFFHFGAGGGGDVNSNVQRWVGQFKGAAAQPHIEPQDIAGTKVTLVSTEGTFSSGMPGGPATQMENYALLGAIIEGGEGNIFVKMTGPAALVKSSRPKFMDFITKAIGSRK